MARAYSILQSNPSEATRLFERAVALDPSNELARRQLGYLYISQGKHEQALDQFNAAQQVKPSDTTKLQIAYILNSLDRRDEASQIFQELESSSVPTIRQKASDARVSILSSYAMTTRWWTRFYAAPYYDTRWNSTFISSYIHQGYYLTENRMVSLYGALSISTDTRSSGEGTTPVIFSDNAMILGIGIRTEVLTGLAWRIQQGVSYDLIKRSTRARVRADFRNILTYSNGIYPAFSVHDHWKFPFYFFADAYASAGYYSRYKNGIGYLQGRTGLRIVEVSRTAFDTYVRLDFVRDTEGEFYNNLDEWGLGARLTPHVDWGLYLMSEFHRGDYRKVSARADAERARRYDLYYNSFRFFIIFDRTF
ncbi:MAG: tetratricopeptide repeat protein [Ignavibacteriae bacterium]|nr:tetratricopeptide repeat protein [Ignavibacteriota bacterium]